MNPSPFSLTACLLLLGSLPAPAEDWPQWFGPNRDGVWRETGIVEKFPKGGPKVLWRTPIQRGCAGPAVSGDRVYVMDREADDSREARARAARTGFKPGNERLLCLDATTGRIIWEKSHRCAYTMAYSAGPRVTPTVDGDRVYTFGGEGNLICRSTKDGAEKWSHDFKRLFSVETQTWGFAAGPLIHGDLIICLAAGDGSTAVAFDKLTGKEAWRALSAKQPGYSPPRIVRHAGRDFLIVWHPESANALDPKTGKAKWATDLKSRSLFRGSPTGADGKIYVQNHAGTVHVIDAKSGQVLHRAEMGEAGDDRTRASIAVAHGSLFIRTNSRLYCIGKS